MLYTDHVILSPGLEKVNEHVSDFKLNWMTVLISKVVHNLHLYFIRFNQICQCCICLLCVSANMLATTTLFSCGCSKLKLQHVRKVSRVCLLMQKMFVQTESDGNKCLPEIDPNKYLNMSSKTLKSK